MKIETSHCVLCRCLPSLGKCPANLTCFLGHPPPHPQARWRGEKLLCEPSPMEPSQHSLASEERCFIDFSGCFSSLLFEKTLSPTEVRQENCAWSWRRVRGQQAALGDSGLRNVQPDPAPVAGTALPRHPLLAQHPAISFQAEQPGVTFANWSKLPWHAADQKWLLRLSWYYFPMCGANGRGTGLG